MGKETKLRINPLLLEKIKESLASVLPITAIVLFLSISVAPLTPGAMVLFLFGALLLIGGIGIFTLGADLAMTPMGAGMGIYLSKLRHKGVTLAVAMVLGIIITIAEPDLQVLAQQVPAVPNQLLFWAVAAGVGIFLMIAVIRILRGIPLSRMLVALYAVVFVVALTVVPQDFIPVSFDSGGVTTGPITVPFIMALGIGIASMRHDKNSTSDSFGLVALCSVGPIMAVLLLGSFFRPDSADYTPTALPEIQTTLDAAREFGMAIPHYAEEVFIALAPICGMFFIFQLITHRFKKTQLLKILNGLLYTYAGLVMFLTGVNVGFMPAGQLIGATVAGGTHPWLLIPIGMLMGYYIVAAEPAVHVLVKQVEEVSMGSIGQVAMKRGLSIGVALSIGIAMLRVVTGINIMWFLIPGYVFALALTFFVPQMFTGIAFDAGGVASGPMTATFLLPFAMGACEAAGGNLMTDAFGLVALVAMMPLITVQIMGLIYVLKTRKAEEDVPAPEYGENDIIELWEV